VCELKRLIKRGGASKEIWCKAQPLGAAVPPAGTSWWGPLKAPSSVPGRVHSGIPENRRTLPRDVEDAGNCIGRRNAMLTCKSLVSPG